MPNILLELYLNHRKVKGGNYKIQTLKCIRAGLKHYMKSERNLDTINDTRFAKRNEMLKVVSTQARKKGLGSTKSTPPIEEEDLAKPKTAAKGCIVSYHLEEDDKIYMISHRTCSK